MTSPGPSGGPTVLRILLGIQLRRLREGRGISAKAAAQSIRASESKISRIELGRNAVREIDVADLLKLYGVDDLSEREQLLSLASQANRPGWWYRFNDILPPWFQSYIGLEEAAESIRVYEPQFVPGLLQTEAYATTVFTLGDVPPEELDRYVAVRKERQRRFAEGNLRLWVILDEEVLRRPVGDAGVMREQLVHLLAASRKHNLILQIIPRGICGHAAPSAFSILRFPDPDLPDIVYVEQLTSALYLDKRPEVDRYLLAMERMSILGTDPRTSMRMIENILEEKGGPA
jgi:transcriptional regulator with XRE-family HTH domain